MYALENKTLYSGMFLVLYIYQHDVFE